MPDPAPTGNLLWQILLMIVLIFFNAFFAASEIAIISLNDTKLKKMAEEGHKKARQVLKLTEDSSNFLATIQIGVTLAGWMNGTGTGFSPNASLDRAMMVTILYRLAGSPAVSGTMPFTDVAAGSWYYDAVLWASQKDITLGTSAATFSPNALLTPDQLGTLLQRFTGKEAQGLPTGQTNVTRAQAAAVLLASVTK